MNDLPVIRSSVMCKEFWDLKGANTASRLKKIVWREVVLTILEGVRPIFAAILSEMNLEYALD